MKTVLATLEEMSKVLALKEGEEIKLQGGAKIRIVKNPIGGRLEKHLITGGKTNLNYTKVIVAEPSGEGITSLNQDQTINALETGKFETLTRGGKVHIMGHLVNADGTPYKPNSVDFEKGDIARKVTAVIDSTKCVGDIPEKDEGLARIQLAD